MINMFINEFNKILKSKSFSFIFLVAILLNAIILIYHCDNISELHSDSSLITIHHADKINSYHDKINSIISQAKANLKEFNTLSISDNTYNVKYQQYTIERYTQLLKNIEFSDTPISGWDIYFSYQNGNIFILCLILISGILIFTQDHIIGAYPMVFSTKNGRIRTAIAKISVSVLLSLTITTVFVAEAIVIIGLFYNFSSPSVLIQNIDLFYLSPYYISIFHFFLISFFLKLLSAVFFCFITELLCIFIKNYVIIYISSLGFLCFNFIQCLINYVNPNNLLKTTNLFAAIDSTIYFERLRTINFLGNVVPLFKFTISVYSLIILTSIIIIIVKYSQFSHNLKTFNCLGKLSVFLCGLKEKWNNENTYSLKTYSFSLFKWEIYKATHSKKIIPILCLITIFKFIVSYNEYEPILSYSDAVYHDYMTILEGEDSLEKRKYILSERNNIDTIISSFSIIQSEYYSNQIDAETYRLKLNEYNIANNKSPILQRIESHVAYIDEMQIEGKNAWFVYDTGWLKLFFSSFDWALYAAIILLTIEMFSLEYESKTSSEGFEKILRTSKNGRFHTLVSKYLSSVFLSFVVFVIYHLIDLSILSYTFDLPLFTAPICSIESFSSITVNISIIEFYLLFLATKILSVIFLAVILCSLSELFTNLYVALTVTVAFSILPNILVSFGVSILYASDFLLFMQATPLILNNTVILYSFVMFMICTALLLFSKRKWCS